MVVLLATTAAVVIGFGDYLGGRATAQRPALMVALVTQSSAAVVAAIAALTLGWQSLHGGDLVLGGVSGVATAVAVVAFFHALAHGRMSVVAPVTAAVTTILPVLWDVADGVHLRGGTWAGIAVVLVAIPMVAVRPGGDHRLGLAAELGLSTGAGVAFAAYFVLIGHTAESSGHWPVTASFVAGTVVLGMVAAAQRLDVRRPPAAALGSGVCYAVAGACIARALQLGPISVASVLGSMYPVVTTALAVRLDGERLRGVNTAGVLAAVAGAALIGATR